MPKLPGLYTHCDILTNLIRAELPNLAKHMAGGQITTVQICPPWLLSLMTNVLPAEKVGLHFALFFEDGWLAIYRIILIVL